MVNVLGWVGVRDDVSVRFRGSVRVSARVSEVFAL